MEYTQRNMPFDKLRADGILAEPFVVSPEFIEGSNHERRSWVTPDKAIYETSSSLVDQGQMSRLDDVEWTANKEKRWNRK